MSIMNADEGDIKKEYLSKILVVGDVGTGKTSFIKRSVHGIFSPHYRSTVGVDFAQKLINSGNILHRLQFWDIAGPERFGGMTIVYYKEAMGAFVVYDPTRYTTFEAVKKWKLDIDAKVTLEDNPIPCILLISKIDLLELDGASIVPGIDLDEFCRENGFKNWFGISSKDNTNLDKSIMQMAEYIEEYHLSHPAQSNSDESSNEEPEKETQKHKFDDKKHDGFSGSCLTNIHALISNKPNCGNISRQINETKRYCAYLNKARSDMAQIFMNNDNENDILKELVKQIFKMSTDYYINMPDTFKISQLLDLSLDIHLINIKEESKSDNTSEALMILLEKYISAYRILKTSINNIVTDTNERVQDKLKLISDMLID